MSGITIGQEAAAARATSEDTVTALREAIGVISSVCDYAQSDDAQGFNAADAWLGHVLAQMPTALWTDDAALATWDMLRKYRGQLAAAGIGYDDLPRLPTPTSWKPDDASKSASGPASTRSTGASSSTARHAPICAATQTAARSPWPSPTTRTWSPRAGRSPAAATTARPRPTCSPSPASPP
jgi:hypothetical protein